MLAAGAFLVAALVAAQALPQHDGFVTDLAGVLTPAEELALESKLEQYRAGTTHELAVLIVPELGGRPVERFAIDVARSWGLGQKDQNNGALLLVAVGERELRIEVGRGLEGPLTDMASGRIIRDVIVPQFKAGKMAAGIEAGLAAMQRVIGGDPKALPDQSESEGEAYGLWVVLAIFLLLVWASRRSRSRAPWILGLPTSSGWPGTFGGSAGSGRSFGGGGGRGFGGFGGGGGFSGGGASGRW
jgi:uncharacterized protein